MIVATATTRRPFDVVGGLGLVTLLVGIAGLTTLVAFLFITESRAWGGRDKVIAVVLIATLWAMPFLLAPVVDLPGDRGLLLLAFPLAAGPVSAAYLTGAWILRRVSVAPPGRPAVIPPV